MKIKVIFTGGTISSTPTEMGINVSSDRVVHKLLIENYYKATRDHSTEFEICQPLSVLSENMTIGDWNILLDTLRSTDFSMYNGIIIAHGTDTLAYTTNLLSIILAGIKIPVVMVSSDYVLSDERANGNDNFRNAVDFIRTAGVSGVYSVYRNAQGRNIVYLGSRMKQCACLTNEYKSTFNIDFGEMIEGKFNADSNQNNPQIAEINSIDRAMLLYDTGRLQNCVAQITPYPGLDYSNLALGKNVKAVIHYLNHGSTLCAKSSTDYMSSFKEFVKLDRNSNISFYVAPYEKKRNDLYASTKDIESMGVIPLYNICEEMAYIKLVVAFSCKDEKQRQSIIESNIFFEEVKSI